MNVVIANLFRDLLVGVVAGFIVWVLTVLFPERKRRKLIRESLSHKYRVFREEVCRVLVSAEVSRQNPEPKWLAQYDNFYQYYTLDKLTHWWAMINGLNGKREIALQLGEVLMAFRDELVSVKMDLAINDEKLFNGLTLFIERTRQIHSEIMREGDMESVCDFLIGFMGKWSVVKGEVKIDWVDELIRSI